MTAAVTLKLSHSPLCSPFYTLWNSGQQSECKECHTPKATAWCHSQAELDFLQLLLSWTYWAAETIPIQNKTSQILKSLGNLDWKCHLCAEDFQITFYGVYNFYWNGWIPPAPNWNWKAVTLSLHIKTLASITDKMQECTHILYCSLYTRDNEKLQVKIALMVNNWLFILSKALLSTTIYSRGTFTLWIASSGLNTAY